MALYKKYTNNKKDFSMTDAQLERIKVLTNLFTLGTISEEEHSELEELQREWLLHSDMSFSDNYHVQRTYQK